MASVKLSHVTKVMAANEARFYSVKDNGKVLDEQDRLEVDTESAIAQLEETFAGLTGSFVTVMVSNKNRMDKGNGRSKDLFQREFTVMLTGEKAIAGTADNGSALKELMRENIQLREQIMQTKHDIEIEKLNKRLEDIESGANSKGLTGFPIVDNLLANEQVQLALVEKLTGFMAGPQRVTALAGVNGNTEQLIEQIEKIDPDFETVTLPLLAQLAVSKPETYKQGILFLKGSL